VTFAEESYLCEQGDEQADYLYIIYRGACNALIDGKQLDEPYGTMQEGSWIWDVAMISDQP